MLGPEGRELQACPWSSFGWYLAAPEHRPGQLHGCMLNEERGSDIAPPATAGQQSSAAPLLGASTSVVPPFYLRSTSVVRPLGNGSYYGVRTEVLRRYYGGTTEVSAWRTGMPRYRTGRERRHWSSKAGQNRRFSCGHSPGHQSDRPRPRGMPAPSMTTVASALKRNQPGLGS
jgi:hypothetical protein